MIPRFIERKLGEHGRHSSNLSFGVIFSVGFPSYKNRGFIDVVLVQNVQQHILRLVETIRVVFVVKDHCGHSKIPSCDESEIVPPRFKTHNMPKT